MRAVLMAEEVRALEGGRPVELADGTLMQRAAFAVATTCARVLREARGSVYGSRVVVLAGRGNNAGDALFAAAHLARRGCAVDVLVVWGSTHVDGLVAARAAGARVHVLDDGLADAASVIARADLIVDGLLGIGATGALRTPADVLSNLVAEASTLVVAVDLPSGVDADTGRIAGAAVRADVTVTFAALKPGLVVEPGRSYAGGVEIVDIGIGDDDVAALPGRFQVGEAALHRPAASRGLPATVGVLDALDVAAFVPEPEAGDHKYRRGVVGLAVGSPEYPGAALLASGAASIGVAGMVCIDADESVASRVIDRWPSVVPITSTQAPARARVTAWACGSGWPDRYGTDRLTAALNSDVPVVIDAGAIGLCAEPAIRALIAARTASTVITPHEGELARLIASLGLPAAELDPDDVGRLAAARAVAVGLGVVMVLKGAGTVVAAPDSVALIDASGGPELAVAGSGDVLTGIVGAVLANAAAQLGGLDDRIALHAVAAAVWLHGTAGRIAADGGRPVSPLDIVDALPAAVARARRG